MPPTSDRRSSGPATAVVVCVTPGNETATDRTIAGVLAQTPVETAVVVIMGGTPPQLIRASRDLSEAPAADAGAWRAFDLVLVRAPCTVSAGWLQGLRAAAHSDVDVAEAVALDVSGEALDTAAFHARAATVAHRSVTAPRRLAGAAAPCVYRRASAAQLTGATGLNPQFARAARARGLSVVLAENVLVCGGQPARGGGERDPAVRDAVAAAIRRSGRISVLVDARSLSVGRDGTRTHVLGLLAALSTYGGDRAGVTALIPRDLDPETHRRLKAMRGVATLELERGAPLPADLRVDVAHRPYQVAADAELVALRRVATRIVVTHQDLISYQEPAYFPDPDAFFGYREMTARALSRIDAVLFFSAHVRDQAIAEGLVDGKRGWVTGLCVDQSATLGQRRPDPPRAPDDLVELDPDAAVLLCLGSDYLHKNRPFAIDVHAALRRRHGWKGSLVLAGSHVRWGSSAAAERAALESQPGLAESVRDLGEITDAERDWLIRRAALVLYPTLQEGFGLMPFEAAVHDRPCLWAAGSSLREFLPSGAAAIVPWDAEATADAAHQILASPERAAALVAAVTETAATLTAERFADRLIAVYREVCERPAAVSDRDALRSEDAARLVGPGGLLPHELERPLLALASRERLARPAFATLGAMYRTGRWVATRVARRP